MCTVSYIPLPEGNVVTANRDEAPVRNADGLTAHVNQAGQEFLIAMEPLHGGTNLAIGKGFTTVLLNGAFRPHERRANYRISRGLVVLNSLNLRSLRELSHEDVFGVEPFTLMRFGPVIEELRWDETELHFRNYETSEPLIVASAKLYDQEALGKRQEWFKGLLDSEMSLDHDEIWSFHINGGDGDPENDMLMNRGNFVRTVSVTQVITLKGVKSGKHYDVIRDKDEQFRLEL